ncbi:MAG: hypothetical protein ACLVKO_09155 [Dysgonomonas sp.]
MKKIPYLLFMLVLPFVFSACSDDDDKDNGGDGITTEKKLPVQINVHIEDDRIPKKFYIPFDWDYPIRFHYDVENRLESYTYLYDYANVTGQITYMRDGNIKEYRSFVNNTEDLETFVSFEYKADTIVASRSNQVHLLVVNSKRQLLRILTKDYKVYAEYKYDDSGNLTEEAFFQDYQVKRSTYRYDRKYNAFKDVGTPSWFFVYNKFSWIKGFRNNIARVITETTYYDVDGKEITPGATVSCGIELTYNSEDYIETVQFKEESCTYTMKYEYKEVK